jgi:hypothetical protein
MRLAGLSKRWLLAALAVVALVVAAIVVVARLNGEHSTPRPVALPAALKPTRNSCIPLPSACGFPDATNTGPRPGTTLTKSGSITLSHAGQTVTGLEVTGCVRITAPNILFTDSIVHGTGCRAIVTVPTSGHGAVLDHIEIDGSKSNAQDGSPDAGLYGWGFTAIGLNIHDTGDGIDVESNDTVVSSWIHQIRVASGSHSDGIQATGASKITIRNNTILATGPEDNAGIILGADQGDIREVTVESNLIDGSNVAVNAGNDPGHVAAGITFRNNRLGRSWQQSLCNTNNRTTNDLTFESNVFDNDGTAADC